MKLTISSERDIDAFRAGVRAQEREALEKERWAQDWDMRLKRVHERWPTLIKYMALKTGDWLLSCEGGDTFFNYARVAGVYDRDSQGNPVAKGYVWIEYDHIFPWGGSGGSRVGVNDPVLVARVSDV